MTLFDTHCHYECAPDEITASLSRAAEAGVGEVMVVGGSQTLNAGVFAAACPALKIYRAIGWDRDQAENAAALPALDYKGISAVGEIGLDFYYPGASREKQISLFSSQLELARKLDLPVVIHTREADDDTLGVLKEIPSRGIIHCFTGSPGFCRKLLDLGFYISISGIVTFRAADNVRESALVVPDNRLLIETDAPFLAPVPMRGRENEPAFIAHTARFLANLRKTSLDNLAEITTGNARKVLDAK